MTTTDVIKSDNGADIVERVLIAGDLSKLNPADRVAYYVQTCKSLGLNPLTKPFEYITLNGRQVLYARKDATDQLRATRKVSITKLERERMEGIFTVTAYARTPDGREDSSIGAVSIENLKGDALANALMKAETKAKRRVTLSICGLGMLDETELETIPELKQRAPLPVVDPESSTEQESQEDTLAQLKRQTDSWLLLDNAALVQVRKEIIDTYKLIKARALELHLDIGAHQAEPKDATADIAKKAGALLDAILAKE